MAIALRQSTASQEIPLGYFLDSTDGNSEETALTIANTDIKIWKAGATTLANKNSGGATHISNGVYYAVLDATDTDTVGPLVVFCHPTGALAVRVECQVYEEVIFDSLFGASAVGYQVPIWAAASSTVSLSGTTVATVTTTTTATNLTNAPTNGDFTATMKASINTEADTALTDYGALKPTVAGRTLDVTTGGAAGIDWGNIENKTTFNDLNGTSIDSATNVSDAAVSSVGLGAITSASFAASAITAAALAPDAVAEIVDAVFDENMGDHLLPGSTGTALNATGTIVSNLASLTNDIGTNGQGLTALPWNAAWDTEVQSEVQDAIEVNHLDHLLAADYDPASKPGVATALLNELIESDAGVSRFTANALEQGPSGGGGVADWTADERTAIRAILGIPASGTTPDVPSAGALKVIDDFLDTEIAAILADTNELQTDWANGGRLDLILDSAASAGDPWSTALPGAYGAGTAGKIIGDNINAPIGTVDTVVDAIKAKTDNLPTDPADQSAVEAAITAATSPLATAAALATVDDFLDTEIAAILADTNELQTDWVNGGRLDLLIDAIKAKTDNLPAAPAATGDAMTLATDAVSAAALSAAAVDEILDEVVEGSTTVRQVLRALLSLAAGKTSRAGSTIYFRDFGDTKNRLSLTVDTNADRTSVSTDLT